MRQSKLQLEKKDAGTVLTVEGSIDENTNFPELDTETTLLLRIDLSKGDYINSSGVRKWVTWLWGIEKKNPFLPIHLEGVPSHFIRHFISIRDFIPKSAKIDSIKAMFACFHCDESMEKLVMRPTDKTVSRAIELDLQKQVPKCQTCGEAMELDMSGRVPGFTNLSRPGN
jgi:uncharacterized CHY-type Zn-finger protein